MRERVDFLFLESLIFCGCCRRSDVSVVSFSHTYKLTMNSSFHHIPYIEGLLCVAIQDFSLAQQILAGGLGRVPQENNEAKIINHREKLWPTNQHPRPAQKVTSCTENSLATRRICLFAPLASSLIVAREYWVHLMQRR